MRMMSPDSLMDLLITQLGLAGVPQQAIRKILGCDINRVSRILTVTSHAPAGTLRGPRVIPAFKVAVPLKSSAGAPSRRDL